MPTDKPATPRVFPLVHLNGTSSEELRLQLETAAHALQAALGAMQAASPNARDFYPQGAGAFGMAEWDWRLHCTDVHTTLDFVRALHANVCEQEEQREDLARERDDEYRQG